MSLKNGFHSSIHQFDAVYSEIQRQERFYKTNIQETVDSFVDGQPGCVLVFGPTSSGKTFTLQGKPGG